jgi:MFS superfamily sulfate permease-like transporter
MSASKNLATTLPRDLVSGLIVFLVALPLCLGIALASGAPLFSGLIAGIVGGIVIGALSGSHTSVSGPAAGLTAVVASQIGALGSFESFLLAVVIAGVLQVVLGFMKAGALRIPDQLFQRVRQSLLHFALKWCSELPVNMICSRMSAKEKRVTCE